MTPLLAVAMLKLAVLNLNATGVDPAVAANLSEALVAEVAQQGCCQVISTSDIQAMLGFERERQMLSCAEESSCLAELGGSLGVSKLVVGNVGKLDDTYLLNLKLIDTQKAVVEARTSDHVDGKPAQLLTIIHQRVPQLLAKYLPNAPVAAAAIAPPPPPKTEPPSPSPGWTGQRIGIVASGASAVVLAGVGAWMHTQANASHERYAAAVDPAEIQGAKDETASRDRLSTGAFIAAGVAAAALGTLLVVDF